MKRVLILSLLTLGITTLANAQATRTWVSGVGDDANPCSRTAPCKTFAGAISKTASPGIINCLDPGGFGAVTITKSITIDCTGTLGSILSSGVQGVVINALTTDKVVLRNIDINGAGTTLGTNAVNIIQASNVSFYSVFIENYANAGVKTTNTSNTINVLMHDVQITNIGQQGVLALASAPGASNFMIDNSHISKCANGIDVGLTTNTATCSFCELDQNSSTGFLVEQTGGLGACESCTIVHNGTGVLAGLGAFTPTIRLSRSLITGNTSNGIGPASGTTKCFSNNVIDGNTGSNACSSPDNPQH